MRQAIWKKKKKSWKSFKRDRSARRNKRERKDNRCLACGATTSVASSIATGVGTQLCGVNDCYTACCAAPRSSPGSSAADTRRTKGGHTIRSERTPLSSFRSNSGFPVASLATPEGPRLNQAWFATVPGNVGHRLFCGSACHGRGPPAGTCYKKDCHVAIGIRRKCVRRTRPPIRGFFREPSESAGPCAWRSLPFGCAPSRHTGTSGEDPTLPYQTLVCRESARLFWRVCPLGTLGVLATRDRAGYGRSCSPDGANGTASTPRRASTIGRISPISWGPCLPPERAAR